jgi:hypothetical protein
MVVLPLVSCSDSAAPENRQNSTSSHQVLVEITANTLTYANARVYDIDGFFDAGAVIKVDGVTLVKQSYDGYYAGLTGPWTPGSSHTFSVATSDGGYFSGSISKPSSLLTGATWSPPKPVLSTAYTVTPPPGGWPLGSVLLLSAVNGGSNYGATLEPTGTFPELVDNSFLTGASSVSFSTALQSRVEILGFFSSSVTVTGNDTSW